MTETLVLGLLELSPTPLSQKLLVGNFDADAETVEIALKRLIKDGYIQEVSDGYFEPTEEGKERVMTRGAPRP